MKQWFRSNHVKTLETDPNTTYFMIQDPATHETVAITRWRVCNETKTMEQVIADEEKSRQERETEERPAGLNYDAFNDFREAQAEGKREHLRGRPYLYLHILAVHPDHQRKGIGAFGLQWGLQKADELGLPIYLESSRDGRRLYAKHGFKVLGRMDFDDSKYGPANAAEHTIMLREPQ